MRIALIGPTFPFRGGIAHYTTLLCRALRRRHEVRFYSFLRQYPSWLYPGGTDRDTSRNPIRVEDVIPIVDPVNPISWWRVSRAVARDHPDLLIIPWWVPFWGPVFFSIVRMLRLWQPVPVLYLCHNVTPHEGSWLATKASRIALGQGDYFIVHSTEERERLRALLPSAVAEVSPHPTYDVFGDTRVTRDDARAWLGLSGDVVLFFGFVRPYKGLRYLLEAVREVLSLQPVTLLVVGEFWEDVSLYRQLVDQLGIGDNVRIVDAYVPNEDVARYFCAADLVVLPYVSATGSGVGQIALGVGCPLIVTDVPGLSELVVEGETGYIVPPADAHALAGAITRFLCEADRDAFRARTALHNERFSWERMVQAIEDLVRR